MLRDRSLIPLSQQHHNGLALCVLTDRELKEDAGAKNLARLAKRIVDRYEVELANHFQVEEEILFPACEADWTRELIAEHRQMERLVAEIRENPSTDRIAEFTGVLRRHIRKEERELFERIQKEIPREKLDKLGGEIDAKVVRVCL